MAYVPPTPETHIRQTEEQFAAMRRELEAHMAARNCIQIAEFDAKFAKIFRKPGEPGTMPTSGDQQRQLTKACEEYLTRIDPYRPVTIVDATNTPVARLPALFMSLKPLNEVEAPLEGTMVPGTQLVNIFAATNKAGYTLDARPEHAAVAMTDAIVNAIDPVKVKHDAEVYAADMRRLNGEGGVAGGDEARPAGGLAGSLSWE
jgi:hypothetical protein